MLREGLIRVLPGQYYDAETGKHYNYYRDYDASLGRYIQSDPIGLIGGLNTFGYVLNSPLRWSDRKGLCVAGEDCPGVGQIDIPSVPYSQDQCITQCILEVIAFGGSPKPGPNDVLRAIGSAGWAAASAIVGRANLVMNMVQVGDCLNSPKCPPNPKPLSCSPG